jgi:hypothetical protein
LPNKILVSQTMCVISGRNSQLNQRSCSVAIDETTALKSAFRMSHRQLYILHDFACAANQISSICLDYAVLTVETIGLLHMFLYAQWLIVSPSYMYCSLQNAQTHGSVKTYWRGIINSFEFNFTEHSQVYTLITVNYWDCSVREALVHWNQVPKSSSVNRRIGMYTIILRGLFLLSWLSSFSLVHFGFFYLID